MFAASAQRHFDRRGLLENLKVQYPNGLKAFPGRDPQIQIVKGIHNIERDIVVLVTIADLPSIEHSINIVKEDRDESRDFLDFPTTCKSRWIVF